MKLQLSKRLQTIASYVLPYRYLIDVGTDHCLVPIYLCLQDKIDHAIATDVKEGPLDEAKKNIDSYALDNKIEVRLGNGLEPINKEDSSDAIVVAGMGGKLITDILSTGKEILPQGKRLILQPNVSEDSVRIWLSENYYEIVFEEIVCEDDFYYEIIVAERRNKKIPLTNNEIKFGPILIQDKNAYFIDKWQRILAHKKSILKQIPEQHENRQYFIEEITQIETILK